MRYLVVFGLSLLALGVLRIVGCGEEGEGPERCETDEECNDQNDCTSDTCHTYFRECQYRDSNIVECDFNGVEEVIEDGLCVRPGLVCEKNPCDDDNECTWDLSFDDECEHMGCDGCQPCDWNGNPGVCIDGVCTEYPCNGGVICDDGDLCTLDFCDYEIEMCLFNPRCRSNQCRLASCDPADGSCHYTPVNDGAPCGRYCVLGSPVCSDGECICLVGSAGAFEVQP